MELNQLYRDLEGLIIYAAKRYAVDGHAILAFEDLISEGRMVFAQVWELTGKSNITPDIFKQKFKTHLWHHMASLMTTYRYTQKRGFDSDSNSHEEYFIDLSEMVDVLGYEQIYEIYYQEYVDHIRQTIRAYPGAVELFNELIDPCETIWVMAMQEAKRREHLQSYGILVRGAQVVRVKKAHIQSYLGLSSERWCKLMVIIRATVLASIGSSEVENANPV